MISLYEADTTPNAHNNVRTKRWSIEAMCAQNPLSCSLWPISPKYHIPNRGTKLRSCFLYLNNLIIQKHTAIPIKIKAKLKIGFHTISMRILCVLSSDFGTTGCYAFVYRSCVSYLLFVKYAILMHLRDTRK